MEEKKKEFEELAAEAYRRFTDIAGRYYFTFKRPTVSSGDVPNVIFLGNHSSGKSTLINWVLGGKPIEDVGLAPTDDGFTVIRFGETDEDVIGPAALGRLPAEFKPLEVFGGTFLQHLRVKFRNRELLRRVTLIDSPGMIDAAEGTVNRAYDFPGVVRQLSNLCDIVFFLLDPEKPGTTGETVSVFAKCLGDIAFKLRVLLNKCDAFTGMYDFARTYGTVCWNLARVLHTKDLPKIWTLYAGGERTNVTSTLDFSDFNRHRRDFLNLLADAAERRRDNVFSQVLADFLGLSTRMCVVNAAARRLFRFTVLFGLFTTLLVAALGLAVHALLVTRFGCGATLAWTSAGIASALGGVLGFGLFRLVRKLVRVSLANRVDDLFAMEYRQQMVTGTHDNLKEFWLATREETAAVIRRAPLHLPLFGEFRRRQMERVADNVLAAFPRA